MKSTPSQSAASTSVRAKKTVQRKAGTPSTKTKARKTIDAQARNEQIALRAYFIGERRRNLGIPGDETSDWVEAEREIMEELKAS